MADGSPAPPVTESWKRSWKEVIDELAVEKDNGLSDQAIKRNRQKYGPNRLRRAERRSPWDILIDQFRNLVVILLLAASAVSFFFGEVIEAIAIAVVIVINAVIGFVTELRAVRSMESLQELGQPIVRVRRKGEITEISAEDLVLGDIVILEGGDVVSADVRLIEAANLQADESVLTGESIPVSKQTDPLEGEAPLAERTSMLFKGTAVTRGSGEGVVVASGMQTELGRITSLVEEAEEEITPLEERLDQLGQRLVWVTLAIAAVIAITGILSGKEPFLIIETAIALAVATVPEGLPIVATIALARGMWRMAHRNALMNRLSAVETLGATNVICTDKTGTLTENRMTVTQIMLAGGNIDVTGEGLQIEGEFNQNGRAIDPREHAALDGLLRVGVLCSNASLQHSSSDNGKKAVGEPMEVALLVAGAKAGVERQDLLETSPEVREVAFDPDTKMMATFHREDHNFRVAVKGAPEAVLEACSSIIENGTEKSLDEEDLEDWSKQNEQLADEGLRVLALATKTTPASDENPYSNLTLLGLAGILDPPREEVRPAIQACKDAGIRVVMVTGDHPVTARKIATAVNLVAENEVEVILGSEVKSSEELSTSQRRRILEAHILARVSPEQKLNLITLHQQSSAIVAMTGDGVNDAPALKKADIGIAMGQRGTEVAKEAADMVLRDDAFSSIVAAVEQGRVIFENIRKFIFFLISCNISEIMVITLASLVNAPLPLLPLQILYLNLVTDVFPALALGVGEGDPNVMKHPPRDPEEPVLTGDHWMAISGYGFIITLSVLGNFFLALTVFEMQIEKTVTISFLTLAMAQLLHVFNMRDRNSALLRNEVTRNLYVWGAIILTFALLLAAVYLPGLSVLLQTVDPGSEGWLMVLAGGILPLILGQMLKFVGQKRNWRIPF